MACYLSRSNMLLLRLFIALWNLRATYAIVMLIFLKRGMLFDLFLRERIQRILPVVFRNCVYIIFFHFLARCNATRQKVRYLSARNYVGAFFDIWMCFLRPKDTYAITWRFFLRELGHRHLVSRIHHTPFEHRAYHP